MKKNWTVLSAKRFCDFKESNGQFLVILILARCVQGASHSSLLRKVMFYRCVCGGGQRWSTRSLLPSPPIPNPPHPPSHPILCPTYHDHARRLVPHPIPYPVSPPHTPASYLPYPPTPCLPHPRLLGSRNITHWSVRLLRLRKRTVLFCARLVWPMLCLHILT